MQRPWTKTSPTAFANVGERCAERFFTQSWTFCSKLCATTIPKCPALREKPLCTALTNIGKRCGRCFRRWSLHSLFLVMLFQQLVCKPWGFLLKSQHSLESTSFISSKNAAKTPQMHLYGTSTGPLLDLVSTGPQTDHICTVITKCITCLLQRDLVARLEAIFWQQGTKETGCLFRAARPQVEKPSAS